MAPRNKNSALRSLRKSSFTIVNSGFRSFASLEFFLLSTITGGKEI